MSRRESKISDRLECELALLADGSLRSDRRRRLLARMEGDPALREELALQRGAAQRLAGMDRDPAPSELHNRVVMLVNQATKRRPPFRWALLRGGPVLACVAATATLVISLIPAGQGAFTLGEAVALTKAPVLLPAPLQSVERGAASRSGWRPEGASVDRISGRLVNIVFYASRDGTTVGYAIVGGPPINVSGGVLTRHNSLVYHHLTVAGQDVTTWVQSGHTHLLSGNVNPATLSELPR